MKTTDLTYKLCLDVIFYNCLNKIKIRKMCKGDDSDDPQQEEAHHTHTDGGPGERWGGSTWLENL